MGGVSRRAALVGALLFGGTVGARGATKCDETLTSGNWSVRAYLPIIEDQGFFLAETQFFFIASAAVKAAAGVRGAIKIYHQERVRLVLQLPFMTPADGRSLDPAARPASWKTAEIELTAEDGRKASLRRAPTGGEYDDLFEWNEDPAGPVTELLRGGGKATGRFLVDEVEFVSFPLDLAALPALEVWGRARAERLTADLASGACAKPDMNCFLTTATCMALGLPDDCFELAMLRRHRDEVMARTAEGRAEIAAYRALAPRVMGELAPSWRKRDWVGLYLGLILPAALLIRCGMGGAAHRLYRARVGAIAARLPAKA